MRLPALEAVAEAARALAGGACAGSREEPPTIHGPDLAALEAALTRLDATPAPATSTHPTPTDRELQRIYEDAFVARSDIEPTVTRVSECADAGRRALYNAGRAACVARLREMAADAVSRGDNGDAFVFGEAADALESER